MADTTGELRRMESSRNRSLLEERFEQNRPRLRLLALRMLGTMADADDAVQESWLKASRSGIDAVENIEGWLTTVTSRVCIDMLRSRSARRETLVGFDVASHERGFTTIDPEREAFLAEAIGSALLIVLDELSAAERVSYVLHDMFDVPYQEIAALVSRSQFAVRQLASRARRRVRGAAARPTGNAAREREIVRAFLAAAREGNFDALLQLLSPDVVFRADEAGVRLGAAKSTQGSAAVVERILRVPRAGRYALVNGKPGIVGIVGGKPLAVVAFTIKNGKIVEIELTADFAANGHPDIVVFAE